MQNLGLNEIREKFLKFFETKDHLRLKSASLIPHNDNSLLIINSGMAPLKPYFTGQELPPSKRVATCQKCIRTGDIENVGKTARHGTFFEMLGDFSFGDYFKNEIIPWSWEFVTKVLEIPEDKLYVTVYLDDDEAYDIWHEKMGLPKEKIFRMGKEDNFWEHGLGPCGPCSEIYFDRGEEYGCGKEGCTVGCDCDRYMEFWNLVFTQFNKNEDGSYSDLEFKNIDTGMGLERMATIMQGVDSIFDVDTVKAIRDEVCRIAGAEYFKDPKTDVSVRVITDHIRSVTFMTADGILPSNEGRGYVLRRLLRRAVRHGKLLGIEGTFLAELCKTVIEVSKDAYPELWEKRDYISKILTIEENSFHKTIDKGIEMLKDNIEELKKEGVTVMDGEKSFRLYDTYGFPLDLTKEILEEEGLSLDESAFEKEMKIQRERSRKDRGESTYMGAEETVYHRLDAGMTTAFLGYDAAVSENSKVTALVSGDEIVKSVTAGSEVAVFLDKTPFYVQSGGQAGDKGVITSETAVIRINDCVKVGGGKTAHMGIVEEGFVSVGDTVKAEINIKSRRASERNHSATHLLHKALKTVLGAHVEQAGSLVGEDRLRFDFTHFSGLSKEEIDRVQKIVNEKILENIEAEISEMDIEEARKKGAVALFGEKYGNRVRVVEFKGFSMELCGGAHVRRTSEIGSFKILSEGGIASGVRRIEALTGESALEYYENQSRLISGAASALKTTPENILKRIEGLLSEEKRLSREVEKLKSQMAGGEIEKMIAQAEDIRGIKVVSAYLKDTDAGTLRGVSDKIKEKLASGVVILAGDKDGKVSLIVCAANEAVALGAHAGNIIKEAAAVCGGGGGGKPNTAQAGGKDASRIKDALEKAKEILASQLK